jgi:glucosylceramidase
MNCAELHKKTTLFLSFFVLIFFIGCGRENSEKNGDKRHFSESNVDFWLTKADSSILLNAQPSLTFKSNKNNFSSIVVNPKQSFQTIEGFGFSLTGGSAEVINNLNPKAKQALLIELFGNQDNSIKISYLRISIGASDLDRTTFSYSDLPDGQTDPELNHFSLDPDRTEVMPLLKEILTINPDIKIMGSPWSPPVWMKDNKNTKGGSLLPEYHKAYANYFVKYIQGMKAEGIPIDAVTPQNEPLHPGNNPSLYMPASQQAEFIKNFLGPAFVNNGIDTKIIIYDHNCDKPEYPLEILNDPEANPFVAGTAFHLYGGDISALSTVHDAYPDKGLYFTEQYTSSKGLFGDDLQWHIKNVIIGSMRNWSKIALEWNLANNEVFEPHTKGGCTVCKGALTIVDDTTVQRNVG